MFLKDWFKPGQAAEKGHNLLLGTMSDINKEIAGTL